MPLTGITYTVRFSSRLRHLNGGIYIKVSLHQLDFPIPILPNGNLTNAANRSQNEIYLRRC